MKKTKRVIKSLYRAFLATISSMLSRRTSVEKIEFSDIFYVAVPRVELTLNFMTVDDVFSMNLSVNEASEIFRSIKSACDKNGITEIKVGELSWKTDARDERQVTIKFRGPPGGVYTTIARADVASAVADFTRRFGLE
jgi:hypothetical protein